MIIVENIKWDIDLEENDTYEEFVSDYCLPSALEIDETYFCADDGTFFVDDVVNYLSDEFGFTVESFTCDSDKLLPVITKA